MHREEDVMTSPPHPRLAGRSEWIGLAVLALACLVYAMDLTVLHLAVPSLSAALEPSSAELLWIIDIYGFLVAGSLITMGNLGDRIGRRRLLMIGAAAFALVSVVAAFATSPAMLIASRAAMGVAGATVAPSTLSLIFNMFPDPAQRARAIGVWIAAFSAGGAVGPMVGGFLLEHFWWGSVFLMAVPVMALLLVLGPRVLPEYRDADAGRLDLVSAAMSLGAVLAIIFGLKETAQGGLGIVSTAVVAVGVGIGYLFLRRQRRLADPLIDLALFRIPTFDVALATNLIAIFVASGYFLFVAQYLQLVLGLSPLEAGMWSLPSALGFIVGSQAAPRFVARIAPARILGVSLGVTAVGLVMLASVTAVSGLVVAVVASIVISLALAPVFGLTTELIVGSAPPERAGAASGISETAAELGGSLGIAVLGSLGTAIYRAGVAEAVPAGAPTALTESARDTLGGAVAAAARLPDSVGDLLLAAAREAFVDGLRLAALVSAAIAVVAAVVSLTVLRHVRPGEPDSQAGPAPETVGA
jgi:MFS transporter, DHA2 family, multidrug resistance protein